MMCIDASGRERFLEWIDRNKPRLVVLSYPRKLCETTMSSSGSSQERRRKYRKICKQRGVFEFIEQVFHKQLSRGDDALAEDPIAEGCFRDGPVQRVLDHPDVYTVVDQGFSDGRSHPQNKTESPKPALWISTSADICQEIALRCPGLPGGQRGVFTEHCSSDL